MKLLGKILVALSIVGGYILLMVFQQSYPTFRLMAITLAFTLLLSAILYIGVWMIEEANLRMQDRKRDSRERRARMKALQQDLENEMAMDERFLADIQALRDRDRESP